MAVEAVAQDDTLATDQAGTLPIEMAKNDDTILPFDPILQPAADPTIPSQVAQLQQQALPPAVLAKLRDLMYKAHTSGDGVTAAYNPQFTNGINPESFKKYGAQQEQLLAFIQQVNTGWTQIDLDKHIDSKWARMRGGALEMGAISLASSVAKTSATAIAGATGIASIIAAPLAGAITGAVSGGLRAKFQVDKIDEETGEGLAAFVQKELTSQREKREERDQKGLFGKIRNFTGRVLSVNRMAEGAIAKATGIDERQTRIEQRLGQYGLDQVIITPEEPTNFAQQYAKLQDLYRTNRSAFDALMRDLLVQSQVSFFAEFGNTEIAQNLVHLLMLMSNLLAMDGQASSVESNFRMAQDEVKALARKVKSDYVVSRTVEKAVVGAVTGGITNMIGSAIAHAQGVNTQELIERTATHNATLAKVNQASQHFNQVIGGAAAQNIAGGASTVDLLDTSGNPTTQLMQLFGVNPANSTEVQEFSQYIAGGGAYGRLANLKVMDAIASNLGQPRFEGAISQILSEHPGVSRTELMTMLSMHTAYNGGDPVAYAEQLVGDATLPSIDYLNLRPGWYNAFEALANGSGSAAAVNAGQAQAVVQAVTGLADVTAEHARAVAALVEVPHTPYGWPAVFFVGGAALAGAAAGALAESERPVRYGQWDNQGVTPAQRPAGAPVPPPQTENITEEVNAEEDETERLMPVVNITVASEEESKQALETVKANLEKQDSEDKKFANFEQLINKGRAFDKRKKKLLKLLKDGNSDRNSVYKALYAVLGLEYDNLDASLARHSRKEAFSEQKLDKIQAKLEGTPDNTKNIASEILLLSQLGFGDVEVLSSESIIRGADDNQDEQILQIDPDGQISFIKVNSGLSVTIVKPNGDVETKDTTLGFEGELSLRGACLVRVAAPKIGDRNRVKRLKPEREAMAKSGYASFAEKLAEINNAEKIKAELTSLGVETLIFNKGDGNFVALTEMPQVVDKKLKIKHIDSGTGEIVEAEIDHPGGVSLIDRLRGIEADRVYEELIDQGLLIDTRSEGAKTHPFDLMSELNDGEKQDVQEFIGQALAGESEQNSAKAASFIATFVALVNEPDEDKAVVLREKLESKGVELPALEDLYAQYPKQITLYFENAVIEPVEPSEIEGFEGVSIELLRTLNRGGDRSDAAISAALEGNFDSRVKIYRALFGALDLDYGKAGLDEELFSEAAFREKSNALQEREGLSDDQANLAAEIELIRNTGLLISPISEATLDTENLTQVIAISPGGDFEILKAITGEGAIEVYTLGGEERYESLKEYLVHLKNIGAELFVVSPSEEDEEGGEDGLPQDLREKVKETLPYYPEFSVDRVEEIQYWSKVAFQNLKTSKWDKNDDEIYYTKLEGTTEKFYLALYEDKLYIVDELHQVEGENIFKLEKQGGELVLTQENEKKFIVEEGKIRLEIQEEEQEDERPEIEGLPEGLKDLLKSKVSDFPSVVVMLVNDENGSIDHSTSFPGVTFEPKFRHNDEENLYFAKAEGENAGYYIVIDDGDQTLYLLKHIDGEEDSVFGLDAFDGIIEAQRVGPLFKVEDENIVRVKVEVDEDELEPKTESEKYKNLPSITVNGKNYVPITTSEPLTEYADKDANINAYVFPTSIEGKNDSETGLRYVYLYGDGWSRAYLVDEYGVLNSTKISSTPDEWSLDKLPLKMKLVDGKLEITDSEQWASSELAKQGNLKAILWQNTEGRYVVQIQESDNHSSYSQAEYDHETKQWKVKRDPSNSDGNRYGFDYSKQEAEVVYDLPYEFTFSDEKQDIKIELLENGEFKVINGLASQLYEYAPIKLNNQKVVDVDLKFEVNFDKKQGRSVEFADQQVELQEVSDGVFEFEFELQPIILDTKESQVNGKEFEIITSTKNGYYYLDVTDGVLRSKIIPQKTYRSEHISETAPFEKLYLFESNHLDNDVDLSVFVNTRYGVIWQLSRPGSQPHGFFVRNGKLVHGLIDNMSWEDINEVDEYEISGYKVTLNDGKLSLIAGSKELIRNYRSEDFVATPLIA